MSTLGVPQARTAESGSHKFRMGRRFIDNPLTIKCGRQTQTESAIDNRTNYWRQACFVKNAWDRSQVALTTMGEMRTRIRSFFEESKEDGARGLGSEPK